MERFKYCISWISWPALMIICIAITAYGFSIDMPIIYFNLAYLFMIIALLLLERWMPHEKKWTSADGQTFANIAHTLLSKGVAQGMLKFTGLIGLAEIIQPMEDSNHGIWPVDWPMWAQAALGLVAAEFGLYWAHCNVEMRFGPLNYFFATPGIHRWHHSMNLTQGDMNYGENVVIWDLLFGTFYNESHRPPAFIGIPEYMPPRFVHQLLWPFLGRARRAAVQARYPDHSRTPEEIALAKIS